MERIAGGHDRFGGIRVDEIIKDESPFEEVVDKDLTPTNGRHHPNVNTMKEMADLVTAVARTRQTSRSRRTSSVWPIEPCASPTDPSLARLNHDEPQDWRRQRCRSIRTDGQSFSQRSRSQESRAQAAPFRSLHRDPGVVEDRGRRQGRILRPAHQQHPPRCRQGRRRPARSRGPTEGASFQFALTVRNKLLDAYREVMRMSV